MLKGWFKKMVEGESEEKPQAEPATEASEEVAVDAEEEETPPPAETATPEPAIEASPEPVGLFKRLKEGLDKTRKGITDQIDQMINNYGEIDEDLLEELEEILITADVGMETTMAIVDRLRDRLEKEKIKDPHQIKGVLGRVLAEMMAHDAPVHPENKPLVILVIGVNGAGKTTSIGKMAHRFKQNGKSVLLAAADTFRAAAIDQLVIWADRVQVPVIKHTEGSDPAAVVFDAIQSAKAKKTDVLICDTAGRLHNKKNLMRELEKIAQIVDREYPEAEKEVLLVLDATTGQNAIHQAKTFKEAANITGIVLTKLDGSAKGGAVLSVSHILDLPVRFVGVGESIEDLQPFDPEAFAGALMGEEIVK